MQQDQIMRKGLAQYHLQPVKRWRSEREDNKRSCNYIWMKSLTPCQGNDIATKEKTMRTQETAGFDIEWLTLYQGNMTRVERTIVRYMAELGMKSLTCCQGNEATGRARTSIRRNRAGQADMKSLTACQGNKARKGERSITWHNWTSIKVLTCYQINMFKVEEDAVRRDTARCDMELLTICWSNMIRVGIDRDYEKRCSYT